jgi:hypothetical protein
MARRSDSFRIALLAGSMLAGTIPTQAADFDRPQPGLQGAFGADSGTARDAPPDHAVRVRAVTLERCSIGRPTRQTWASPK